MRDLFIILLFTLGLFGKVFSDVGNCVKYEVEIQLMDGQKIRGFVYIGGYEKKFQFKETPFLDYLKRINPSDTFHVFKNIRQLKFPTTNEGTEKCEFRFNATTADNDIKVSKKKIRSIEVISYTVCNNCDDANEETGYYSNGIHPAIITELNKTEIDLLQTKPIASVSFGHDIENNTERYWMISYSADYKQPELEKLKKSFLVEADKLLRENKWYIVQDNYKTLKNGLRKKKIILFKISYAL